jgi:7,8-dihydro-6-hydroxymethylpterin dimethyltransferase
MAGATRFSSSRTKPCATASSGFSPESGARTLRDLLCCLPRVSVPEGLGYANIFRVLIVQFIDAYSFDVRSVKKTCIHIVHPDGRLIPFDTYNLFYRDALEQTRLAPLRRRAAELDAPLTAAFPRGTAAIP